MPRLLTVMWLLVFVLTGCGGSSFEETVGIDNAEEWIDGNLPDNVESDIAVELGVVIAELITISINSNGEVSLGADVPIYSNGLVTVTAGGDVTLSERNRLVIIHNGEAQVFDPQSKIEVKLDNVTGFVRTDGKGNVLVEVVDSRATASTINIRDRPLNAPNIRTNTTLQSNLLTIGQSAKGEAIEAYQLGNGRKSLVLIGGLHAGFAPASSSLMESLHTHFRDNPRLIPEDVTLTIIPTANPDSASGDAETLLGRLNGNGVDINRNWDCNWKPTGTWRSTTVNGGSQPFSEPETDALRTFLLSERPEAVLVWGATGQLVIPGSCDTQTRTESQALASAFATVAGYKSGYITSYTVNGDITDWLDSQGIPAAFVLLPDYRSTDLDKNRSAIESILLNLSRR
ncbi:MAG: M14 family metallopeptidase [Candidatus Promineifilaceae bacterium]